MEILCSLPVLVNIYKLPLTSIVFHITIIYQSNYLYSKQNSGTIPIKKLGSSLFCAFLPETFVRSLTN